MLLFSCDLYKFGRIEIGDLNRPVIPRVLHYFTLYRIWILPVTFLTLRTINLWCIILRCVSLYVACVTASYIQSTSMLNINVHVFIIQRVFSVSHHALQHLPSALSSNNAATSPVGSHSRKEVIFCINMYVIHRFKFCSVSHLLTNVGIHTGKNVTDKQNR